MAQSMAADRMRDRHREAAQRRSLPSATDPPAGRPAGPGRRPTRGVSRRTGLILIALGRRLTGEDPAGLALVHRDAGHSTA
jgi:hypothetical protein